MLSSIPFEIPAYLQEKLRRSDKTPMAVAGADNLIALKSAHQAAQADLISARPHGNHDRRLLAGPTRRGRGARHRLCRPRCAGSHGGA